MLSNNIKEQVESFGLKKAISYLDSDPDKNIPKVIDWVEKFDKEGTVTPELKAIKAAIADKDGNWYQLVKSLYSDIDDQVRKTLFENFIINSAIIGGQRQRRSKEENSCNIHGQSSWIPPRPAICIAPDAGQLITAISFL
jgi:hypothetical protein